MGKFTFKLPDIGEGIAEAEIVAWHVKVGDRIEEDGRIADVMTDKATVEMESPVSGVVLEVAGAEGDMVAIGAALVVIEVEGEVEVSGEVSGEASTGSARADVVEQPSEKPEPAILEASPQTSTPAQAEPVEADRKSTRLNSSHG